MPMQTSELPVVREETAVVYRVQTLRGTDPGHWGTVVGFRRGTAISTKDPEEAAELVRVHRAGGVQARRIRVTTVTETRIEVV